MSIAHHFECTSDVLQLQLNWVLNSLQSTLGGSMNIALPLMDSTNCLLSNNARFVGKCGGKLAVWDEWVAITLSVEPFFNMGQICTIQPIATLDFLHTYLLSVSCCKTTLETVRLRWWLSLSELGAILWLEKKGSDVGQKCTIITGISTLQISIPSNLSYSSERYRIHGDLQFVVMRGRKWPKLFIADDGVRNDYRANYHDYAGSFLGKQLLSLSRPQRYSSLLARFLLPLLHVRCMLIRLQYQPWSAPYLFGGFGVQIRRLALSLTLTHQLSQQ